MILRREGAVPADVVARAGLQRRDRVLASGQGRDGSWLLGTRRMLVLVGADRRLLLPWEEVEDVRWDTEDQRLHVTGIGEFGSPRPSYSLEMAEPTLLLQLVRERVTASIVLQRRVAVRDGLGLSVIGRRSPAGGPIRWMHAYDEGLDPADPEVTAVAQRALDRTRSELEG